MGVSIEVYRSRIGAHHNFTNCRDRLHCFKGKLWNQILLMFYLNVFYFPLLKSQLKKAKSNRELCQWYVQMIYYHAVYVPLLLRLSNDVEENPGPRSINDIVDPTYTVHADFNQGNELMFGMNAGKQCVAISLYAVVYKEIKSVNIWDRLMLNSILISGNSLYSIISQSINKSYLLLTDIPEFVEIENHVFNLQYSDSISGALHMSEDSLPHVTLEHALNEVFISLHYNSCLLTIGMNTVAIMMPFPGVFKVFDSHSRDVFGRPSALGHCVLIPIEGIENLAKYFQLTSMSDVVIPFELKGVTCIATELSARFISNSGMTDSIEVFEQHDLNNERSNTKKVRRHNESTEQRKARLAKMREYNNSKRKNETGEQREARCAKNREYNISKKQNETAEQREARLAKNRERVRASRKRASSQNQTKRKGKCSHQIEQGTSNPVSNFLNENIDEVALVTKFHNSVAAGPLYICTCCDQLWYKHSVLPADRLRLVNPEITKYLQSVRSVDNIEWICQTCNNHLKKGRVPPCAIANGMQFPEKPSFFDLNELECRLIAPRLAFQKIFQAPRGGQLKITGNVVNVPADVNSTVNMLPRLPDETGTIKVQLKRRLQYKSSALSLNIRPHKVMQAAAWLVNTSPLYEGEGITIDQNWLRSLPVSADETCGSIETQNDADNETTSNIPDDQWSEDEAEIPAGTTDSMLTTSDFVSDNEKQEIYNFAPGAGNKPLSVFRDQFSEEMAYPGIFLGQKRPDDKERLRNVHYSEICKSELRRSDRRAAMCVENIFFKAKKLQMKFLIGQSQIALRKNKMGNRTLTAGVLKTTEGLQSLINHDDGFRFLKTLRGSPPYFEKAKKDLFAMIRQLGPASLFCSFSSAETKWNHLLRIIGKLIDHKDYSDEELNNLTWEEKCRLIQSDPVTCARLAPLGKIKDWFYRVEYQQRGSPHIHMLIWLDNAPVFGVDKDEDVVAYIDRIITCSKPESDPELQDLVNRQTHRHSHTCRKKSKNICRFNYPQPPMRCTQILYPLDNDTSPAVAKSSKELWNSIKNKLNDFKEGKDITFDELLQELEVSERQYILAIQSSLKSPTIFLKRSPNELRINNYNRKCLRAWRANMDIQYVLDVYACAMYIVSYISKAQKGMSELLRKAVEEAKEGNTNIKQQVRDIGNKFLNSVEISAQEAVYVVLQLPMRKASRSVVFINTSPPAERVELLKPLCEIENLSDDCEEIQSGGLLKRYTERPERMQNITLADWAAWYDSCGKKRYRKTNKRCDVDNLLLENEEEENDDELLDDNSGVSTENKELKKRTQARIIRSVWFNKEAQPEKHYRELLMLFTSWRNEETDLIKNYSTFEEHYLARRDEIGEQMQQYAICCEDLNEVGNHLQECVDDGYDTIAPVTQDVERQDQDEGCTDTHPDLNETLDHLSDNLGIPSTQQNNEPLILNEMPDDEYRGLVQMLNKKQREFFYHALHLIKTSEKPFYAFLSGGGGVGKSHLIKSIYQAALKYYNSRAGQDFRRVQILLLAPTGKAAYLIKGNTIHSAFGIPASQSLKNYKPLDSGRLNTMRCELGALKLILLDEMSMVGNSMFTVQLNNRLKDLKGTKEDFGGVSIITLGDLFQLKPVMDGYVFTDVQCLNSYNILAPNLWRKHFKMFELDEIMRQRESKMFAEILNRLREGNHTASDLQKLKERCVDQSNCPTEAPRLFIQNALVDEYNDKVYQSFDSVDKYTIKAQDSVIGACSAELKEKIMRQIPYVPLKNSKQLAHKLNIAVDQRTEIAINIRTDDGMTNGASNVIKHIHLTNDSKPSGLVWVQFDYDDVGRKTRQENRNLYTGSIPNTWTPIKPVTTQFAVGKTKSAQVVRKQFPLRPASAKTVHRSQGDTQSQVVVNLNTRRTIPHIHYVALSRVTTIEGLYITDLCESKISVDPKVVQEMQLLRNEYKLDLCFTPLYMLANTDLKMCYLNARSLHKHIEDVRKDINYLSVDILIFTETRFCPHDPDEMYIIDGYELFRDDETSNVSRPYHGIAVYLRLRMWNGYPYARNCHGIELIITKTIEHPNLIIIGIYRPPRVVLSCLLTAIRTTLEENASSQVIFMGDFNVNWLDEVERRSLYNLMINENGFEQLISSCTTDNGTLIDHLYTNMIEEDVQAGTLETYFSDHKAIWASVKVGK